MSDSSSTVCQACIGDRYLQALIAENGHPTDCDFCHKPGNTISIEWLADKVEDALHHHYSYTSPDPDDGVPLELLKECEWERKGEPLVSVIADLLRTNDDQIAECVQECQWALKTSQSEALQNQPF